MNDDAIMDALRNKIREIGYAKVAVKLNYRDTDSIKKWISRKNIPAPAKMLIKVLWIDENERKKVAKKRKNSV